MNDLITNLEALSNAAGISGNEGDVRQVIRPLIENSVDDIQVDALGNLIAYKAGTGTSELRVLITAHMDEVGLMVVGHNSDGTLKVDTVGGIPARLLPGLTVYVGAERISGVIGLEAIHRANRTSKAPDVSKLAVDIGANGQSEAQEIAPLGAPVVFATQFKALEQSCLGKAFDDRAGCAILINILRGEPLPCDIYGAFTVQEEVGLRGARVAAYAVAPDVGITLEGTLADDLPKPPDDADVSPTTELGKGPAITVMDRSYTTPPRLLQHVIQTAEDEAIPFQIKQPGIGGTDAGGVHQARAGVPAITVAVPCRYIHSPVSMLRVDDLRYTAALVGAAIRRLTQDTLSIT
jgi:tetrahedral aminopeptidase